MKIVFAGTPEFALPSLEALYSAHSIAAVYTQPDRPAGRGQHLQASPVKQWAEQHHLPVLQPLSLKNPDVIAELKQWQPDVIVVIAYGLILPKAVLDLPRWGCINVHASLLPRWRGASPIQQAILHGDKVSGVTIMQMDVGMDTGAMLQQVIYPIKTNETAGSLHDELARCAVAPLLNTLDALQAGHLNPVPQDEKQATYAPKITKEDALIHWHESADSIDRKIRAYYPWPVAFTHIGDTRLRIYQARPHPHPTQHAPGTLLKWDKTGLFVATGKDILVIETLQLPGGKMLSVADYLNAGKTFLAENLVFT